MIANAFWKFVLEAVGEEMFTNLMKQLAGKITGKVAEKVQKRVEKALGIDTEQAGKDISDEIFYSMAVAELSDDQADEVDAFEARLRRADKEKAEALVLFVATIVTKFQKEVKKTTNNKKGESGPSRSESYMDFAKGLEYGKKILLALLRVTGSTPDETFNKRVIFLEGKNVFSLIKAKKGTSEFEKWLRTAKSSMSSFWEERSDVARSSFEETVTKLEQVAAADCDEVKEKSRRERSTDFLKKLFFN
ncbi:MAG: hypothetical protein ACD_5C00141G0001 [uncultured bacterium]|nr:MAG: hypothetical protein ACD_5C00141G0001 [uncultured bacterium]